MQTHYSVLGCEESSSFEEIKKRYQELALKYHPDKAVISCELDRTKFHKINTAWTVLKDPESRNKYNAELKQSQLADQPLIFSTLTMNDFQSNIKNGLFTYPCRCGGIYRLDKDDLISPECSIECDECSFSIVICS